MMPEAKAEVPLTAPMRAAWEKYKETEGYANTRRWALHKEADEREYVDGSLWAAFCIGWEMALSERPEGTGPTPEAGYQSLLRETAGEKLGAER